MRLFALSLSVVFLAQAAAPAKFLSVEDYLSDVDYRPGATTAPEARTEKYEKLIEIYRHGFDYICGDTFCEGDYGNLTILGISCSVRVEDGMMKACHFTIAGSNVAVDPETGKFGANDRTYTCTTPLPGVSIDTLLKMADKKALKDGAKAYKILNTPIGDNVSMYEALSECF